MRKIFQFLIILILLFVTYYFFPEPKLPENSTIDLIKIYKSKHELLAFEKGKLLKTYSIAIGSAPVGPKQFEGDKKTPEGTYFINDKNPNSGWYKNLGISYPNKNDRKCAYKLGKSPGGAIKIHGIQKKLRFIGKLHRWSDWTLGCIAVTNTEMDELYYATKIGARVEIHP